MTVKTENEHAASNVTASAESARHVQLGMRLQPVDHSDQPVFSNFSAVQGAPGVVFIDFGFLEPNLLPTVARLAQSGGKVPEAVTGRLAARVVLGIEAAAQLAQQLEQHLRSLRAQTPRQTDAVATAAH